MSVRDRLHLRNITVTKTTATLDQYGDPTTTSQSATIERGAIWSPSQGDRRISDKIAQTSTHVLAIESSAYSFGSIESATADSVVIDTRVSYDGVSYMLVGHPDDVANKGLLTLHGMERIT